MMKKNTYHKKSSKTSGGYTLLFAVLVSSVVLAIGISILTISKKEFLLSSSARDSTSAFYAADSGLECAIYWDKNSTALATSSSPGPISCGSSSGTSAIAVHYDSIPDPATIIHPAETSFDIQLGSSGSCAVVSIKKYYDNTSGSNVSKIDISSKGYNIGWNGTSCSTASPRRVERELHYLSND